MKEFPIFEGIPSINHSFLENEEGYYLVSLTLCPDENNDPITCSYLTEVDREGSIQDTIKMIQPIIATDDPCIDNGVYIVCAGYTNGFEAITINTLNKSTKDQQLFTYQLDFSNNIGVYGIRYFSNHYYIYGFAKDEEEKSVGFIARVNEAFQDFEIMHIDDSSESRNECNDLIFREDSLITYVSRTTDHIGFYTDSIKIVTIDLEGNQKSTYSVMTGIDLFTLGCIEYLGENKLVFIERADRLDENDAEDWKMEVNCLDLNTNSIIWKKTLNGNLLNNPNDQFDSSTNGVRDLFFENNRIFGCGSFTNSYTNSYDGFIFELNPENGEEIWSRTYDFSEYDDYRTTGFGELIFKPEENLLIASGTSETDSLAGKIQFLLQVGINETIEGIESDILTLNEESNIIQLENALYPNPTNGTLFLQEDFNFPLEIDVFDLTGRKVFSKTLQNKVENIHIKELNGLYLVTLSNDQVLNSQLIYFINI